MIDSEAIADAAAEWREKKDRVRTKIRLKMQRKIDAAVAEVDAEFAKVLHEAVAAGAKISEVKDAAGLRGEERFRRVWNAAPDAPKPKPGRPRVKPLPAQPYDVDRENQALIFHRDRGNWKWSDGRPAALDDVDSVRIVRYIDFEAGGEGFEPMKFRHFNRKAIEEIMEKEFGNEQH